MIQQSPQKNYLLGVSLKSDNVKLLNASRYPFVEQVFQAYAPSNHRKEKACFLKKIKNRAKTSSSN